MTSDLVIILLFLVIIAQGVERYFSGSRDQHKQDRLLDELSRATKAVISKNANDYVMTAAIDKVATEEKPKLDSDLVSEETLSDDEFMQAIHKDIK